MNNYFLVIDSLVGAGAQRQLTNLAVGLSERGHHITLFFYHPKYDFLGKIKASNIDVVEAKKRGRFDVRPLIRLYAEIRSRTPDVVIAYLRTPSIYCELIKLVRPSTKLIVSERSNVKDGRLTLGDMAAGFLHSIASHVTSNSYDYLNHLTIKMPFLTEKSSVIYNGVESKYFNAFRSQQRFVQDGHIEIKFAVVAARCTAAKGALVVARALEKLTADGIRNVKINWIGPVDFESDYVKMVTIFLKQHKLESYWHWHGRSHNVMFSLAEHDALISASFQEGVSNVICEAMALGVPVIASEVSDNAYILEGGRFGALFEPGNAEDLCGVLGFYCALSKQDLEQKSELAHQRALELFSMSRMVLAWEALCVSLSAKDHH